MTNTVDSQDQMLASDLINKDLPPLKPTDTVKKALSWMESFRVSELPVVDKRKYLGVVQEEMLYELSDSNMQLGELELEADNIFVKHNTHFYDVVKTAEMNDLKSLAVIDEQGLFMGTICVKDSLARMAKTYATQNPGGILVVGMDYYDYSLSNIARLIEENNAKILSSFLEADSQDSQRVKLTLKIDQTDLTRIIATLERFEYTILAKFDEAEINDYEKDRLDLLFRLLNI
ncbi:MAG: CBS domain-containing protein [Cytophagales bacterium]|nr:MAG: CBS domain-containing protein [Cytophagales bacterium]TAF60889.1 MAG: CBS domain-containing protein [Cytophagales bacterium]